MSAAAIAIRQLTLKSFSYMTDDEKAKLWLQGALWAAGIYVSVTLSLIGYCVMQLSSLNERMIAIKATSFTAADADKLRDAIQDLSLKIATEPAPKWLIEQVQRLQTHVDVIERERRK